MHKRKIFIRFSLILALSLSGCGMLAGEGGLIAKVLLISFAPFLFFTIFYFLSRSFDTIESQHQQYKNLLEDSGQGIIIHQDFRPIFLNKSSIETLGFSSAAEVLSMQSIEGLVGVNRAKVSQEYGREEKGNKKDISFEIEYETEDDVLTLECVEKEIDWFGEDAKILMLSDITATKRTSVALSEAINFMEESLRLKSNKLLSFGNEVSAPLTQLKETCVGLSQTDLSKKQKGILKKFNSLEETLSSLVEDMLKFSSANISSIELKRESLDANTLVHEVYNLFKNQVESSGLGFKLEVEENASYTVVGDYFRLRQILINLLSNALKFTPKGNILLKLSSLDREGRRIVSFEVQDNGVCISPLELSEILKPLSDENTLGLDHNEDSLGLTLSKRLINLMGGELFAESVKNQGSRFWFDISFEPVKEKLIEMEKVARKSQGKFLLNQGERVLIADDNHLNRLIMKRILEGFGASVELATDGLSAARKAKEQDFSIVFMDCDMPGLSGFEALREIRDWEIEEEKKSNLPVVMLSSKQSNYITENISQFKANGCLTKPIKNSQMEKILSEFLA